MRIKSNLRNMSSISAFHHGAGFLLTLHCTGIHTCWKNEPFGTTFDNDFSDLRVTLSDNSHTASTVKGSINFEWYVASISKEKLLLQSIEPW